MQFDTDAPWYNHLELIKCLLLSLFLAIVGSDFFSFSYKNKAGKKGMKGGSELLGCLWSVGGRAGCGYNQNTLSMAGGTAETLRLHTAPAGRSSSVLMSHIGCLKNHMSF